MVLVCLPTGRTGSLMILQRQLSGTLVFSKYLTLHVFGRGSDMEA
jgi:hypothetical protein